MFRLFFGYLQMTIDKTERSCFNLTMEKGIQTKTQIIKAAIKLASKEGMEAISIGKIANLVGMSKSGLFGHFKSKENLQIEVLDNVSVRFVDKVIKPALKESRGEPRIRALNENWKNWIKGSSEAPGGCLLIAASSEMDDRPGKLKSFLKEKQLQLINTLQTSALLAVNERHFVAQLDTEKFAWNWFSLILAYHHYKRLLDHPRADEFVQNGFEELILKAKKEQVVQ